MTNSSAPTYVGMYVLGPFSTANPTPSEQQQIATDAQSIEQSDLNTIVLASFHVSETGDINFNDTTMASGGAVTNNLDPNLAQYFQDWKTHGNVQNILMSFGGGGCFNGQAIGYWDFSHIKALITQYPEPSQNPFFKNLAAIMAAYPIDGIDLDLEVYESAGLCEGGFAATYQEFLGTCQTMIEWAASQGKAASIAPYEAPSFWASLLVSTQNSNGQLVNFVNLQNANSYSVNQFTAAFQQAGIGVTDLNGFISGGLQVDEMSPSEVLSIYQQLVTDEPGLGGGWLWNNAGLAPGRMPSEYAQAIISAW